jgi:hypothetical protein
MRIGFKIDDGLVMFTPGSEVSLIKDLSVVKALKLCIRKWKYIVRYYENAGQAFLDDGGSWTCALCALFLDASCEGCPVRAKTGLAECKDTPYCDHYNVFKNSMDLRSALKFARQEVKFLESILKGMRKASAP